MRCYDGNLKRSLHPHLGLLHALSVSPTPSMDPHQTGQYISDSELMSSTLASTSFRLTGTGILDAALTDYARQIGMDPSKHPFFDQLQSCHSPNDVLKLLEDKAKEFKDYREGNRKLIDCLKPVVEVIHTFSGVLGEVISIMPFQPAGAVFVGLNVLLTAASDVSSSYDALVDLFECIGNFLKRLQIYNDISLTPLMTEIIVKIMAELLSVLALATKQIKQGRFKKFAKKLLGESEIEAVLQRLDRLTQEEGRVAMAQTLEVVHCLVNNVRVVMDGVQHFLSYFWSFNRRVVMVDGKLSIDGIWKALDAMQQITNDINKMRRSLLTCSATMRWWRSCYLQVTSCKRDPKVGSPLQIRRQTSTSRVKSIKTELPRGFSREASLVNGA
ncbi:hypothetical protein EDB86DRAFT_2979759 [Lactarius hatsudake]|nr:hypothetical protein EDB86DRAFT_2979759 [Lactarius hatsudake]